MLATSFGLNRPSSGQYLYKLKNGGAYNNSFQLLFCQNILHNKSLILYHQNTHTSSVKSI